MKFKSVQIALFIFFVSVFPGSVKAQGNLVEINEENLSIIFLAQGDRYQVQISPREGLGSVLSELTANVFSLSRPSRLVIDIPNYVSKSKRSLDVNHPFFNTLRLGVHSSKTRLVLDIADNLDPDYSVRSDARLGALIIEFQFPDQPKARVSSSAPAQPVVRATAEPTAEVKEAMMAQAVNTAPVEAEITRSPEVPVKKSAKSTLEELTKSYEPKKSSAAADDSFTMRKNERVDGKISKPKTVQKEEHVPGASEPKAVVEKEAKNEQLAAKVPNDTTAVAQTTIVKAPKELALATPDPNMSFIKGVYYQSAKNSNISSVVIDLDRPGKYELKQQDKNSFELRLDNAKLAGQHLSLPQFPPDTFEGFQVILANQIGKDVVVRLYVEDGVSLSPYLAKGKLWIKTSQ